jgi:amino acid permease
VLLTNMILYTGFGEIGLFIWGNSMHDTPLITEMLEPGWSVNTIKCLYSINVFISISLQQFPANIILEGYLFSNLKSSWIKDWLINFLRLFLLAACIIVCILLGDSLDKFNSIIGTFAATPVAFAFPCLLHYKMCNPTKTGKVLDILVIAFSAVALVFCSGYTIYTWNE